MQLNSNLSQPARVSNFDEDLYINYFGMQVAEVRKLQTPVSAASNIHTHKYTYICTKHLCYLQYNPMQNDGFSVFLLDPQKFRSN